MTDVDGRSSFTGPFQHLPTLSQERMAREEHIEFQGKVVEVLPAGNFRIELENGHQVLAHLGGKLRKHRIRVVLGDSVTVALTPYDPTRGIVVYRG